MNDNGNDGYGDDDDDDDDGDDYNKRGESFTKLLLTVNQRTSEHTNQPTKQSSSQSFHQYPYKWLLGEGGTEM